MSVPLLFFPHLKKKVIINLICQRSLLLRVFCVVVCLKANIFIMNNYHSYYSDMLDQQEVNSSHFAATTVCS